MNKFKDGSLRIFSGSLSTPLRVHAAAERESHRERERQTRNARLLFIFYLCLFYLALLPSYYRSFLSLLRT